MKLSQRKNVILDRPYNTKIEKAEEFKDSLFEASYNKAYKSLKKICEDPINSDKNSKNCQRSAHGEEEFIYNIIPFIGNRGSGKTSVMLSFVNSLAQSDSDYQKNFNIDKYGFIKLKTIDAGHMEENENLFGIVLSRMLSYYNNWLEGDGMYSKSRDTIKPLIYRKFSELYTNFLNVNRANESEESYGRSALTILSDMDASHNLKESFKSLVKEFLSAVSDRSKCNFMVIAIDDIDMNVSNTFKMLEQIQTYMTIPGVVITFTASYDNLMCICQNQYTSFYRETLHIYSRMSQHIGKHHGTKLLSMSDTLAFEYLNKLLPVGKMINLRHTYGCLLTMDLEKAGVRDLFKLPNNKSKREREYCEVIMYRIAQCTELFFYAEKGRECFLVPASLRSKAQFLDKAWSMRDVYSLKKIGTENLKYLDALLYNLRFLQDEVAVRYSAEVSEQIRMYVKDLSLLDLSSFIQAMCMYLIEIIEDNTGSEDEDNNFGMLDETDLIWFESLYDKPYNIKLEELIPIFNSIAMVGGGKFVEFIEILLILYSIKLNIERIEDIKSGNKSNENVAVKYYGSSIFGEFDNEISNYVNISDFKPIDMDTISYKVMYPKYFYRTGYKENLNLQNESFSSNERIIMTNNNIDKDIVHAYAIFIMFLSSHDYKISIENEDFDEKTQLVNAGNINMPKDYFPIVPGKKLYLRIEFGEKINFAFSSFFINICNPKILTDFYERIINTVKVWNQKIDPIENPENLIITTALENEYEKYKKEFEIFEKYSSDYPIPIYNVELLYNIACKVKNKNYNRPYLNPWDTCCQYFKDIEEELNNAGDYYGDLVTEKTDKKTVYFKRETFTNHYSERVPKKYVHGNERDMGTTFFCPDEKVADEYNKIITLLNWRPTS